jgi:hypothetical protein
MSSNNNEWYLDVQVCEEMATNVPLNVISENEPVCIAKIRNLIHSNIFIRYKLTI